MSFFLSLSSHWPLKPRLLVYWLKLSFMMKPISLSLSLSHTLSLCRSLSLFRNLRTKKQYRHKVCRTWSLISLRINSRLPRQQSLFLSLSKDEGGLFRIKFKLPPFSHSKLISFFRSLHQLMHKNMQAKSISIYFWSFNVTH